MDMYEQLSTFRDDIPPVLAKPIAVKRKKPLSRKQQIMKKVLHLTRTKKHLL